MHVVGQRGLPRIEIETHDSYKQKPRVRFDCIWCYDVHSIPVSCTSICRRFPTTTYVVSALSQRRVSILTALHASIRPGCWWRFHSALPLRVSRLLLQVVRHSSVAVAVQGCFPRDSLSANHRPRWRPLAQRCGRPL